jgi:hypothetical protein
MKMVSGSILILAAAILVAARWIGRVMHNSTYVGSPESEHIVWLAVLAGLSGVAVLVWGATDERRP